MEILKVLWAHSAAEERFQIFIFFSGENNDFRKMRQKTFGHY